LSTPSATSASAGSSLFPYRPRPAQETLVREVAELTRRGGPLLVSAPSGSGKTVAALAPLVEHAQRSGHRILYLIRTRAQELQVVREVAVLGHRLDVPVLPITLEGRSARCFLLESDPEVKGATAEEHGKLCADRKRSTEQAIRGEQPPAPPREIPEDGEIDLTDLDGCPYYARALGTDLDALAENLASRPASPAEFERVCRDDNLCPYELAKRLLPRSQVVVAPYAFFFHPHVRRSLLGWMGCEPASIDLVVDEAHNLAEYLRDLATVALPEESVRRARDEVAERGDFQLPNGPSASRFLNVVRAAIEELPHALVRGDDDAVLHEGFFEETLLRSLGGTSHRLDTWLGALATWGENLKEERRRERHLPRSWVHTVAITLLSWPKLEPPRYAKVVTRLPRPALEAFALDASEAARPILDCHVSVHLSSILAPLEEYRDALGLGRECRSLDLPSHVPPANVRYLYDPTVSTEPEELREDPHAYGRLGDRIARILEALPVRTEVLFPDFEMMRRVLESGLQSQLPPNPYVEYARLPSSDLWRPLEGWKSQPSSSVLLGVAGGRLAEGVDRSDDDVGAVVLVGIPYPRPTAKQRSLERFLDRAGFPGAEYATRAPAERAISQAFGRLVRTEQDRGLAIVVDRRATDFASILPGLEPIRDLPRLAREFYGRRARWSPHRPRETVPLLPGRIEVVPAPDPPSDDPRL
jgi:DNA excision repair protein ERCC-2